jgi:bacteriocin biosynthesis cyclodehydratase domain-containing protein
MLKPGVRRVWRGPDTLQLGVDVPAPLVLRPADAAARGLLEALDGRRTRQEVLAHAERLGLGERVTDALLDRLAACGLLTDAATPDPDWAGLAVTERDRLAADRTAWALADPRPDAAARHTAARRGLTVVVAGEDPLAAGLAEGLALAGVDRVETVADPSRARPGVGARLLVVPSWTARVRRQQLLATATPHLVTEVGETLVRLGPLVWPGRSACFGCLEHSRRDRDPAWAEVSAQLAGRPGSARPELLLRVAAAVAVVHLLDWAAGGTPPEVDGLVELRLPHAQPVRRRCPPHPACGCTWPPTAGHVTMAE